MVEWRVYLRRNSRPVVVLVNSDGTIGTALKNWRGKIKTFWTLRGAEKRAKELNGGVGYPPITPVLPNHIIGYAKKEAQNG